MLNIDDLCYLNVCDYTTDIEEYFINEIGFKNTQELVNNIKYEE